MTLVPLPVVDDIMRSLRETGEFTRSLRRVSRGGSNYICLHDIFTGLPRPRKLRGAYRVTPPAGTTGVFDSRGNTYVRDGETFVAENAVTIAPGGGGVSSIRPCGARVPISRPGRMIKHIRRHHP